MPALAPSSVDALLDLIRRSNILPPERLAALPGPGALPADAVAASAELLQQGFITKFQREQLLLGRHKGFRIGPYVIREQLGRGGMGAVYLAEHLDLHRRVAVKILAPGKGEDQKLALERFLREARASASLDHPNIVRTFDVARASQTPYIVMEYVDGETLQHAVDREGALPYAVAAEYIAQAASGLQHAHEKGLVHRDIKPANLMRDRTGVVKLLDLGLARTDSARDKLTEVLDEGAVVGTADYISPEQAMNGTVDCRADIYSLGATFFTLVTGKVPFEGNTTQKLMQHQMRVPPPLHEVMPDIPRELSAVVTRMLAKKPADRYQSAAEVIAALAPWAAASTRVLAGLSSTALGNPAGGTDMSGRAASSSRRLLARASNAEIALGAPPDGATSALSASDTTKDHQKPAPPAEFPRPKSRKRLVVALGVATLAAVAVLIGLALSGGKKEEDAAQQPVVPWQPPPQPKAQPKGEPKPAAPNALVRFASDFAKLQPFRTHSGLTVDPNDANKKSYKLIRHTGPGALPTGWDARCHDPRGEMEAYFEPGPALAVRNLRAGSAMLFSPRFDCPSGVCRVKLEYAGELRANGLTVRFKAHDQRPAWDVARPPVGGTQWRTFEALVDLKGASGGFFEFHNGDAAAPLRVRALTVTEPDATPADRVAFKLDAADMPAFRNTKTGRTKNTGDDDPAVPGVYFGGWKPETPNEWSCGPVADGKALSVVNADAPVSAQIGIQLESGAAQPFVPGQVLRAVVTYRTTGTGSGRTYFQTSTDRTVPASANLPRSVGKWNAVEMVYVRGSEPLRLLVDSSAIGKGNALLVRSVTVAAVGAPRPELLSAAAPVQPQPAPKQVPKVEGPAAWAEGKSLYTLDVAAVPAFRAQKEQSKTVSGEERLPAGVWCQAWKEGAVSEFRRDTFDGAPALGVTNLNDNKSGQFGFSLDDGLGLALETGKAYRLKVSYRTANEATGALSAHVAPGFTPIGSEQLPASASGWKSAAVSFVRPPAADNVKVRVVIDNTSVGEGNTLWVKSVEVVELIAPKP
jgi:eukaryotic-like serine/threonine-protein kinase